MDVNKAVKTLEGNSLHGQLERAENAKRDSWDYMIYK
jgi:hypothetical protein